MKLLKTLLSKFKKKQSQKDTILTLKDCNKAGAKGYWHKTVRFCENCNAQFHPIPEGRGCRNCKHSTENGKVPYVDCRDVWYNGKVLMQSINQDGSWSLRTSVGIIKTGQFEE